MATENKSGCILGLLANLLGGGDQASSQETASDHGPLPYARKKYLLSKAERSFLGVLDHAVGDEYRIFTMIRLADLLYVRKGTEKSQRYRNFINAKHVDFVLCSLDDIQPLLGIELDDASHQRAQRQERDHFVDRAFEAAGLPLLRVPVQPAYNVQELRAAIHAACRESFA